MGMGLLLVLLVVGMLLPDLFRKGSTTKDKVIILTLFLVVLAFVLWFMLSRENFFDR